MQTIIVLTHKKKKTIIFRQVTKLLRSGNTKGLFWTHLHTHLATISRGALYVFKVKESEKEKVFDLFILPFFSFVCMLLSQSSMVEGTWVLASDKPCISQSETLG